MVGRSAKGGSKNAYFCGDVGDKGSSKDHIKVVSFDVSGASSLMLMLKDVNEVALMEEGREVWIRTK